MKKMCLLLSLVACMSANSLYEKGDYKKAYPKLKKECLKGDFNDCYKLGKMNEYGLGTYPSYDYAYKYYKKACEMNDNYGCASLGKMYAYGYGTNKDIKKANELLKEGCDNNIYEACDEYAYLQSKEFKVDKFDIWQKACNGGIANSCIQIALKSDAINAIKFNQKACSLGDDYACSQVANAYLVSRQMQMNIDEFSKVSEEQCNKSNAYACQALGMVYNSLKNYKYAEELYKKSCDLDNKDGCARMGILKTELEKNDEILEYFIKACELNDGFSCSRLGYLYQDGLVKNEKTYIKVNKTKSKKYFTRACELGFSKSCEK